MTTEVIVETIQDTILVETPGQVTIITSAEQGPPGPSGIQNISDALDVDSSNKINGSVLVYSTQNQKWVATTQLENQSFDFGHY